MSCLPAAPRPPASRRLFSAAASRSVENGAQRPPQPPKPIDDCTPALDYKRAHRTHPPPLPETDNPRPRSAKEANEPGVLSRVSGILAGRRLNIDSLVVCYTEIRDLSRMCIVLSGQDGVVELAPRLLEDIVPVLTVLETRVISHELLLTTAPILTAATPSQALRVKHPHLHSISVLAQQFGAKIVDVRKHRVVVELAAKTARVEAFLNLRKPFGTPEAARTDHTAMPLTPITTGEEDPVVEEEGTTVDASLLPPD
ncbi:hypothetical protein HYPSUDRAFT_66347 [Hypholoma sublateritium FD-334 SS-4]|uniref:ACT domain-containing protein n=1 Tax=Hypholoma sublateritium (strain FD-334 SS-4) TaxID=945553 RepID=A0A0D2P3Y2_HYPSF|nr:hypothetical protein HYPSUDRAFT_66347 [Hypholoma sublateritium FD-334 SS-4]